MDSLTPRLPRLYVITGIMASGKSTVAQALAERFDRSVHVRGDGFRRSVVRGRADMAAEPSDEALAQLRLRYELAASCSDRYVQAGFTTVMQDVILGPMLDDVIDMFKTRPLMLVVLAPSVDEVIRREERRAKAGYTGVTPADLDQVLRRRTPQRGLWLDNTSLSVAETVQIILDRSRSPIVIG